MDIAAANPVIAKAAHMVVLPIQAIAPLTPTASPITVQLIKAPAAMAEAARAHAESQTESSGRRNASLLNRGHDDAPTAERPTRQTQPPSADGGFDVYA